MEPQVERALRELTRAVAASETVERARKAREEVQGREAARIMLRDLEKLQGELLERARRGEAVPEDLSSRYRQVAQLAAYNPYLRDLFQAEAELARMLDELQQEILRAVGLAPAEEGAPPSSEAPEGAAGSPKAAADAPTSQGSAAATPRVDAVRSRLWVPGQGRP